jgi:hypothetical protein
MSFAFAARGIISASSPFDVLRFCRVGHLFSFQTLLMSFVCAAWDIFSLSRPFDVLRFRGAGHHLSFCTFNVLSTKFRMLDSLPIF